MSNNSRTMNSIRNITTGFLGQFIQIILGFVNRTIFIKFLAAEYLGISGLFGNILSILSLAELGVGSAIIYALYKPLAEKNEKEVAALMKFYSKAYKVIGVVVIIIGISLTPFLKVIIKESPQIKENLYVIYLFYLFNTSITYFFSYKNSIIVADQKNYISSLISYGLSFAQTILQIIILVVTKSFLLYLCVQAICTLIYNVVISIIADKMYPFIKKNRNAELDKITKRGLITNIKALMIVKLSGVLVNNTDNLIITYFSGLSTVGLSSNYTMLIGIVNTVLNQLFGGITASVGNLNAKESDKKKEEFFNIINFANFWLFGFSAICIIVLLEDVIKIWLGDSYVLPMNIPIILAINFYMVGMQNAVWTYKNTMGLFKHGRYILLFTATLNLGLSMFLGLKFGLFGILLATAIARLLTNAWYDPYAVYKYGLKRNPIKYFIKYIKYALTIFIALIVTLILCNFVNSDMIIGLILKSMICLIIPNIIILIFFSRSDELKYFINIARKIIIRIKTSKNLIRI